MRAELVLRHLQGELLGHATEARIHKLAIVAKDQQNAVSETEIEMRPFAVFSLLRHAGKAPSSTAEATRHTASPAPLAMLRGLHQFQAIGKLRAWQSRAEAESRPRLHDAGCEAPRHIVEL